MSTAPRTLATLAAGLGAQPGVALRFAHAGAWSDWSYAELARAVDEVAGGLLDLGLGPGDRVAILAETSADWTVADLGALRMGAVVVPIYHTNSPEECEYVLAHSGAKALLCADAGQLDKVGQVRERCPALEHVVAFADAGDRALPLAELRARGQAADRARIDAAGAARGPDDPASIVYTSGTTGPPKGCVLTHANWLAAVDRYEDALGLRRGPVLLYLFLPLAHALARVAQFVVLQVGGTIAYWTGDPSRLTEDLATVRPTHFPSVPRVFEKVHESAVAAAEARGALRAGVLRRAVATGGHVRARTRRGEGAEPLLAARHALGDRLVLAKVRAVFGGRLEQALTGAAPIGREVLDFFDACGITVLEGYGMTETCAAATLNTPASHRLGTVGRPLPGTQARTEGDGELLVRGPNVFAGYERDPEATAEILDAGGWLRTGDLASIDGDGFVTITGRKKDIIVTSSGKNISPSVIETALRERRFISQAVVYGDRRSYLVAVLTLDPSTLPELAQRAGVEPDPVEMARDARVHAVLQEEVDEINRRFARIEQVKRFGVLDHDLTQAAGELTPTLKVKRGVVYDRYGEVFAALYD